MLGLFSVHEYPIFLFVFRHVIKIIWHLLSFHKHFLNSYNKTLYEMTTHVWSYMYNIFTTILWPTGISEWNMFIFFFLAGQSSTTMQMTFNYNVPASDNLNVTATNDQYRNETETGVNGIIYIKPFLWELPEIVLNTHRLKTKLIMFRLFKPFPTYKCFLMPLYKKTLGNIVTKCEIAHYATIFSTLWIIVLSLKFWYFWLQLNIFKVVCCWFDVYGKW